jgi:hypothetical protein
MLCKKRKAQPSQEVSTGLGVRHPLLHLLFYKLVEYNVAGICVDGQDLPPVTDDHKIQVSMGVRKSTRAVRINGVGAHSIHWID